MRKDCSTCKHDYDDAGYPVKPPCDNCVYCSHSAPTNWEAADYYKPDTNADRIRAMTDEDLAWELMTWRIETAALSQGIESRYPRTKSDILDWLRQPMKED